MANSQTPLRLRSDPPELRIRFLIQISGWIWGFFLKLGISEILGLSDDVTLFVCVYLFETKRKKSARGHRLLFRVRRGWCQPQKQQLASPAASICLQIPTKILWGASEPKQGAGKSTKGLG